MMVEKVVVASEIGRCSIRLSLEGGYGRSFLFPWRTRIADLWSPSKVRQ